MPKEANKPRVYIYSTTEKIKKDEKALEQSIAANWAMLTSKEKGQSTKPSVAVAASTATRGKMTPAANQDSNTAKKRKASTSATTNKTTSAGESAKPPTKRSKKDNATSTNATAKKPKAKITATAAKKKESTTTGKAATKGEENPTTAKTTAGRKTTKKAAVNTKPTPAKEAAAAVAANKPYSYPITNTNENTTTTKPKKPRKPRKSRAKNPKKEAVVVPAPAPPPPPPPKEPWVDPFPIANNLLQEVEFAMFALQPELDATRELLEKYHEPTRLAKQLQQQQQQALQNSVTGGGNGGSTTATNAAADPTNTNTNTTIADDTTAGHSNTNHQVVLTGDPMLDRLREYQRNYQQRQRVLLPEQKGNDRWDKPRLPGQRRRRIHREVDRPEAPPEPPPVGYTVFVGQMTTKIRHDRPNEHHSQAKVMQEIAKLWKDDMSEADRHYYIQFCDAAKAEYVQQQMEFRASSTYTKSTRFVRLGDGGHGPWIHRQPSQRNALEQELSTYETVDFPLRPASMDEEYQWRDWRSKVNRRMKLRKLIVDYNDVEEQQIVADAVNHAKAELMEEPGLALADVDHSAILAAASQECIVKLTELKEARRQAECQGEDEDEAVEEEEEENEVDGEEEEENNSEENEDNEIVDDETAII